MIKALADAGDLALPDDEIEKVLPWFRYVFASLRGMRELAEDLPGVEPYPLDQRALPRRARDADGS